jgi:hypothetical protein
LPYYGLLPSLGFAWIMSRAAILAAALVTSAPKHNNIVRVFGHDIDRLLGCRAVVEEFERFSPAEKPD